MIRPRLAVAAALLSCLSLPMTATPSRADDTPANKPPTKPCASEDHRRFDFWVGSWEVHNRLREGGPVARNEIRLDHGGCVVREDYTSGPAYTGSSLSFFDAAADSWHQTWIDSRGVPLYLTGGWRDGAMVMTGPDPEAPSDRVTWTPGDDGTVTQRWDKSPDGGTTWKTVFDGLYTPAR